METEIRDNIVKKYNDEVTQILSKVDIIDDKTIPSNLVERITTINIPNNITNIGDNAFWGCESLTSITIPDSVTSIGDNAFQECKALKNIYVKGDIEKIKRVFTEYRGENKIPFLKPLNINEGINNYIYYWAKLINENELYI